MLCINVILDLSRYVATESMVTGMVELARMAGGWHHEETFKREIKRTIGYVRSKVDTQTFFFLEIKASTIY